MEAQFFVPPRNQNLSVERKKTHELIHPYPDGSRSVPIFKVKVTHFSIFQREEESNDKLFPFDHQEQVWSYEKIMGLDDNT